MTRGAGSGATRQAFEQALELHRQGRQFEAEAAYRAILAKAPQHFDALHLLGILRMQQGRPADAHDLVSAALRENPRSSPARATLGSILLTLGRAEEALSCFDAILARQPNDIDARYNRAVVLGSLDRTAPALAEYERVLAARPNDPVIWFNRANLLARAGRDQEALSCYDRALALAPQQIDIQLNRGNVLGRLGRYADALACFDRVLAANPQHVEAMNGRAIVLKGLKRFEEAAASCAQALAIRPDHLGAMITQGTILLARESHAEAIRQFERVLAVDRAQPEALHNRAFALAALNRLSEALAGYEEVLRIRPLHADALNNRGIALFRLGRFTEAIASYDAALAMRPHDADVLHNRAQALVKLDRYREAIADCQRALAINPQHRHALSDLAFCQLSICDWAETKDLPVKLDRAISEGVAVVQPFVFVALPVTAADHLGYTRAYVERRWEAPPAAPAVARTRLRGGRIKLAYLSADFYRHATAWLAAELFERHDRSRFELIGISFGPDDQSDIRRRIIQSFGSFHDVRFESDADVARIIREAGVDIAVDLKGHTENARPAILFSRPASVQATFLGYPGTTAIEAVDYIIADPVVLPFDQQPHFTEKIVQLPDCYQVNDANKTIAPGLPSRAALDLPERGFVFCCFNQSYKFTPEFFDIWMRLLKRNEGSVLWLLNSNGPATESLRREAAARGVDPARLVFAPKLELAEHLARHRAADLFLDTLPCNAHTTASDALWAGLPVLTCIGATFTGRVAASLLRAVGLPELVTGSIDEYEALAGRLASQPAELAAIRQTLEQNRGTQPLYNTDRFCRHIEAAYTKMWDIHSSGAEPRSFAVTPI